MNIFWMSDGIDGIMHSVVSTKDDEQFNLRSVKNSQKGSNVFGFYFKLHFWFIVKLSGACISGVL